MASKLIAIIKENKIRIIIGIVVTLLLSVFTLITMKGAGVKDLIVCLGLGAGTGFCIAFPAKKETSLRYVIVCFLLLAVYAWYVPSKLFDRTQLPTSDMSGLIEGTPELNQLILWMVFFVLLFFTQKVSLAFGIEAILVLLLTVVNYYTKSFRGSGISALDFFAAKTAFMVMGNYKYTMVPELWKSILYFLFFSVFGFRIDFKIKGWKYHAIVTACALLGLFGAVHMYQTSDAWNSPGIYGETGNINAGESGYGLYYYLALTSKAERMDKPAHYSDDYLSTIAAEAVAEYAPTGGYQATVERPNVILIMNEGWSDLGVLGNLETTRDYMPFLNSITGRRNTIRGNAYVNIQGGMTCNSEFEALTGDSMTFLHPGAIPYNMQINHKISSLATVFGAQGYQTVAMHPNHGASWNRTKVYDHMGFDKFVSLLEFDVEYDKIGSFVSDASDFDQVISLYEQRDPAYPFFLFNVTIQNHSPYWGQDGGNITTVKIGDVETSEFTAVNSYLNMMKITDDAFKDLITYFSKVEEPTIICMYGDHQPMLNLEFYDMLFEGRKLSPNTQKSLIYRTEYIVWANYDVQFPQYGDVSASHLGAMMCELAGVEMPAYYKFLLNSRKTIPAYHMYNEDQYEGSDIIEKYKCLQYNQLLETNYRSDIFEASYDGEREITREPLKKPADETPYWYTQDDVICHALGVSEGGETLTNSYEALEYNYEQGFRTFETDISFTSDGVPVLRHDWVSDLGQAEAFGWTEEEKAVPSAEEFLAAKIFGKYTPMTLMDLFEFMSRHEDMYIVFDTKITADYSQDVQYSIISRQAIDNGYEDVLSRVVVQLYYENMYDEVNEVYPFENYLMTMYVMGVVENEPLKDFLVENKIPVLTVPWYYPTEVCSYMQRYGIKVYTHTVDDPEDAKERIRQGFGGIYTDTITPDAFRKLRVEAR